MRISKYPPVAASAGGYFIGGTMLKENSYVCIQAFMVNDLHLSGNELITFAVVYGFSQDGETWFTGSRQYIADWCQTTTKSVTANLKKLVEKGLLLKRSKTEHGLTFNDYMVNPLKVPLGKKLPSTGEETSLPPREETSPHTIEIDNTSRENIRRFVPPSPEEVSDYMGKRGTPIDADAFCDYWESVGWMRGKTKMKDWKAAARQWARNDAKWSKQKGVKWDAELRELADALSY